MRDPDRCSSVMTRFLASNERGRLEGKPDQQHRRHQQHRRQQHRQSGCWGFLPFWASVWTLLAACFGSAIGGVIRSSVGETFSGGQDTLLWGWFKGIDVCLQTREVLLRDWGLLLGTQ